MLIHSENILHCLSKGSLVALDGHRSVPIESLQDHIGSSVLSYSMDHRDAGLVFQTQTGFKHQGVQECVELTLGDGRTLICTPEHRILSTRGWIQAQQLKLNEDKVLVGLELPSWIPSEEDITAEKSWNFSVGSYEFSTCSSSGREKA